MQACLGDYPAIEGARHRRDGDDRRRQGDDRSGSVISVGEAGATEEVRLYNVLVRRGPVLMLMVVADVAQAKASSPCCRSTTSASLIQTAVDKL